MKDKRMSDFIKGCQVSNFKMEEGACVGNGRYDRDDNPTGFEEP